MDQRLLEMEFNMPHAGHEQHLCFLANLGLFDYRKSQFAYRISPIAPSVNGHGALSDMR